MKHILSLIYDSKIQAVLAGTCRQTIRLGNRFAVGDQIMFHGWEARPYRSKWSFRTPYYPVEQVINITILLRGIAMPHEFRPWPLLDEIARLDGIVPPTGEALRDVLLGMHTITGPMPAQIVRWAGEPDQVARGRLRSS